MLFLLLLAAEPLSLSLTCTGSALTQIATGSSTAIATDNRGGIATAEGVTTAPISVALTTGFELEGNGARIFLPAEMRPALSQGKNGWYPVDNLSVGDHIIRGTVKLSFIRTTAIEIDRDTGILTTKHGYRADCTPIDRSRRKF